MRFSTSSGARSSSRKLIFDETMASSRSTASSMASAVGIHFVERDVGRQRFIGREIRLVGEAVEHRRRAGVELVHRRQAEDLLDRAQDARGVVLRADDRAALGVRADAKRDRAVAADVVPAGLRVVFDREDRHLLPELRSAEAFDDAAEGEIVVGDAGARASGSPGSVPLRVIVGQAENHELRKLALLFEFAQLVQERSRRETDRAPPSPSPGSPCGENGRIVSTDG